MHRTTVTPSRTDVRDGTSCPNCQAKRGAQCVGRGGKPRESNHQERVDAFTRRARRPRPASIDNGSRNTASLFPARYAGNCAGAGCPIQIGRGDYVGYVRGVAGLLCSHCWAAARLNR